MSIDDPSPPRAKRERSNRYPGTSLEEAIALCRSVEELGVDGLTGADIAQALGYKSIKTNTFSSSLSSARQFGLLELTGEGYALTTLGRAILHPTGDAELARLRRQALLCPPLYAEFATRMGGKKLPEATILGNVLYNHYQITATAKQVAAETLLESARFAGTLADDLVFHPDGVLAPAPKPTAPTPDHDAPPPRAKNRIEPTARERREVRLDLELWGTDEGKRVRLRAPKSMTRESFERFLQALRLVVRITDES
jgi:hypothetical protein